MSKLIDRKAVVEEIQKDRIRNALARGIDAVEIGQKWKDMKQRQTTTTRIRRKEEVKEEMLRELKALDVERTDLDEMVALSSFARSMKAEYDRLTIPLPEWLEDRLGTLDREIRLRRTDALEKKLKELQGRRDTLKTAEQKRSDVDAEMAKVKAALGVTD